MDQNKSDDDSNSAVREFNPYAASNTEIRPPRDALPVYISVPLAIVLLLIVATAFWYNIGLGISVSILVVPAYIRAVASSFRKMAAGEDVSNSDRLLAFFGSLGVVVLSCIAGGIGFFVTCFTLLMGFNGSSSQESLIIGLLALGFFGTAGLVYWLFWPKRRRQ